MANEPFQGVRPLTREAARRHAVDCLVDRYGQVSSWSETDARRLARELMAGAVDEALRQGDTLDTLDRKLSYCMELVEDLQLLGRSWRIENICDMAADERTPEQERISKHRQRIVWQRYDPVTSFQLGTDNDSFFDGRKDAMARVAANYLSRRWARHPMVDWILLDMMITRESCSYGEELKMNETSSSRTGILGNLSDYSKHDGNLSKMRAAGPSKSAVWLSNLVFEWAIPVGAIYVAFFFGWVAIGWVLVGLFLLAKAFWLLNVAVRMGTRIYRRATDKEDPAMKFLRVLEAMWDTWRALEGPVVNPTMVRQAMLKAKELGAVWDTAAWSIIDRAIAIDPAVMITKPNAGG